MKFKKIYGLILGVVAVGLASCSSDLNNEGNTPINPTKTAKRSLTLSANNATLVLISVCKTVTSGERVIDLLFIT